MFNVLWIQWGGEFCRGVGVDGDFGGNGNDGGSELRSE